MKEKGIKIIAILALFICVQYLCTGIIKEHGKTFANTDEANRQTQTQEDPYAGEYIRLGTDLPWRSESRAGWDQLRNNVDSNGNKLAVMREGAYYTFDHGIWAHATSELYFDVAEYSENYHWLTMYVGLNRTSTAGDGVKFFIYTSDKDNFYREGAENWTIQSDANRVYTRGQDAVKIEIDIRGAKYLRFTAHQNTGNSSDHAVYIEPMLITDTYKEIEQAKEPVFQSIADYDEKIQEYANKDLSDPNYELLILQRKFVSSVGSYALERMAEESSTNLETIHWLMNDLENLRYYILGGAPTGGYYNSIKELTRLYQAYHNDFTDTTPIAGGTDTKGRLYKRMAITLSLTHSSRVALWMQPGAAENQSDAVKRYELYKKLYDEGAFKVTEAGKKNATQTIDITPWFETYNIEEMRWVLGTMIDDEEILWLNEYTQTRIDAQPQSAWGLLTPHPYMAYVWPNYANDVFYAEENVTYFNELFATKVMENGQEVTKGLFDYGMARGTPDHKVYKLWMNFRNKFDTGAVCGGISKSGHCIRGVNAIPSAVIGQPGHAALLYYNRNAEGKGMWGIDNDVSGWAASEKGERMPLGWGNDRVYVRGYNVPYIIQAQEALNDYANLVKAEELLMTVDVYKEDKAKQEQIYREAIQVQSINLDAWAGLVKLYVADETKTEEQCYQLELEMMEALKCFPFPMHNLSEYLKTRLTSDLYIFKYTTQKTKILNEAKNYPAEGETSKVLQPAVTRGLANYLLGQIDTTLATFSFDGTDAGKIILSDRFEGNGLRWDYSLDGKTKWTEVASTADNHKHMLTEKEMASITAEKDIYVHLVGTNYSEENIYRIDIQESTGLPTNLYANDLENRMMAVTLTTEWRYSKNAPWTSYSTASPDLTGNKTVQVRQGASGTRLASEPSEFYSFTEDNQPDTRKYIPIAHLSIKEEGGYSTQSVDKKRPFYAPNAIDGNLHTMWHTDFRYNVLQQEVKPFIIIQLDEPRYISAVEFIQQKYKTNDPDFIKNCRIYVSEDGENWGTEIGKIENCPQDNELRNITLEQSVFGKYVKLEMDTYSMFASLAMVNLFEDTTKVEKTKPRAGVAYSTTEKTNGVVVARLVNPNKPITITNNGGKDTYVFTENGDFTFEFEDADGNKGSTTATVTWIDKDGPTADVEYDLDGDRRLRILLDNISEDVYILDNNNKKINFVEVDEKTKKIISISFLDDNGNTYKIAELDEDGKTTKKITYKNTTNVGNVTTYVTTLRPDGTVESEAFLDEDGRAVEVSEQDKATLRQLQQITRSNPLEYSFEESGDYEFRLLDKANNIAYKSIKVDYITNDTKILVSDITYDITRETNQDVKATLATYSINQEGNKSDNVRILSEGGKEHTFTKNGSFTFVYMDGTQDAESPDREEQEHIAKVSWIDKVAPTARVEYSTTEKTKGPVTATLTGASEPITIINNGTNNTYTFTENDTFVFEFEDKAGNRGTAEAKVTWIEKETEEPNKHRLGDINGDGEITATDLVLVKRHLVSAGRPEWTLTGENFKAGDINGDGEITATDLVLVKRHLVSAGRPEWAIPEK